MPEQAKLTVLLVEDEWTVREEAAAFLKEADCEVIEAADGEAALNILAKRRDIDVVFTDLLLGGRLSGWDIGEASRALDPDIAVVYASGALPPSPRRVARSAFIEKPYTPQAVITTCRGRSRAEE